MILYLDASAGAKLFLTEPESAALKRYLGSLAEHDIVISAALLETELRRAAMREDVAQDLVTRALQSVELIGMPRGLFTTAGVWPDKLLRSLDALHLVTAVRADCDVLVSYDRRLQTAARSVGIEVVAPV